MSAASPLLLDDRLQDQQEHHFLIDEQLQQQLIDNNDQPTSNGMFSSIDTLSKYSIGCLTITALVAMSVALAVPTFLASQIHGGVLDNVLITSPFADGFKQFSNRSVDGENQMRFYFFNITNTLEVLDGEAPELEELGPFVYESEQTRYNFTWNSTADTVTFGEHTKITFNAKATAHETNGRFNSVDDVQITTVNLLFLGMKAMIGPFYWAAVSNILWRSDEERLFTTQSVTHLISGYSVTVKLLGYKVALPLNFPGLFPVPPLQTDPNMLRPTVMRVGNSDLSKCNDLVRRGNQTHVTVPCPWGGGPLPGNTWCPDPNICCGNKKDESQRNGQAMPGMTDTASRVGIGGGGDGVLIVADGVEIGDDEINDVFGEAVGGVAKSVIKKINATINAERVVKEMNFVPTGQLNITNNRTKRVPVWGTDRAIGEWDDDANLVHGTLGEQFSPNISKHSTLLVFNDLLMRTIRFTYESHKDIVQSDLSFRGINLLPFVPHQELFLNSSDRKANARYYQFGPRGLVNLTMVQQGAPVFFSQPHFLGGDPVLLTHVKGLKPNRAKHAMKILVEPITGQTMVEHVRAQVNVQLPGKVEWGWVSDWFPKVRKGVFVPIAWFEDYSAVSSDAANEFKTIYQAQAAGRISRVIGAVVATGSSVVVALWVVGRSASVV